MKNSRNIMIENLVRADMGTPSLSYNDSGCHVRDIADPMQASSAGKRRFFCGILPMQIDFYGCKFEAASITCCVWTPRRGSAPEHRLVNEVKEAPGVPLEQQVD